MPARASLVEVLERSRALGFLGPGPIEHHVGHAEAFVTAAGDEPEHFLDLGSGGGVPGLVLATRWSRARGRLVDGQLRRVRFLEEALVELGLDDRIVAVHGRAEELAHHLDLRGRFDVVTARSFAPPAITAECGAGFLRPGGCLLVAEPPTGGDDRWPADALAGLGLVDEGNAGTPEAAVRRLRATGTVPAGVPRRPAAIRRRPAF